MNTETVHFATRIMSGGRLTIPKHIREKLKLQDGDYIQVRGLTKLPNGA